MRALWLEDHRLSLRDDVQQPEVVAGEALVRVRLAGICATDLELRKGYYPFTGVPGHEFVGDVVEAPDDTSWVGSRVVGEINARCGDCIACRSGRGNHCANRTVLGIVNRNGALAEYLTLPIENLLVVPKSVPDESAVFCEPLAAALEITEMVHLRPSDRVLLVGAGRLGQLIARCLRLSGCDLVAVEREERQRVLLADLGISWTSADDVEEAEFDVVVEASGSPNGFAIARKALRPRGKLVLKSTYTGKLELDASALVVDEITIVGSRCGPFAPSLRLLEHGLVDTAPLIEATYGLREGVGAFEHAAQPGALKVLVKGER